jgi:MoxR-like ATPase
MSGDAKSAILRSLDIVGWDALEPVILAALATESPLLLIGPHGSAKTLVLTRLAHALGVEHRHYNASLLNFDDLIGFPVPEAGKLVYLQTPATIWDAESVFFDEVSRCRPDLQNKLFPIVHERRVQGVALERLRYRWAAMNPPPRTDGASEEAFEYAGAEPLDVALADRFAFIVEVPDLKALSRRDQLTVLASSGQQPSAEDGSAAPLSDILESIRTRLPATQETLGKPIGEYVQHVAQKLAQAKHAISTRRAVQIARNIAALAAVFRATGSDPAPEDAFYVGLRHSIPDAAWGNPIDATSLLTIHRAAWGIARLEHKALKEVFREPDAVRRIVLALRADTISPAERGQIVSDSSASLDLMTRFATAAVLMPVLGDHGELPATSVETVAADYAAIAATGEVSVTVRRGGADWKRDILGRWLSSLDLSTTRGKALANIAAVLMRDEHEFKAARLERAFDHAASCLPGRAGLPAKAERHVHSSETPGQASLGRRRKGARQERRS